MRSATILKAIFDTSRMECDFGRIREVRVGNAHNEDLPETSVQRHNEVMLRLEPKFGVAVKPGSFGALEDGSLLVPAPLAEVLTRHRITTAEKLVTTSNDLPGALADMLGWSVDDVKRARAALVKMLVGHVDDDLLQERVPQVFAFGALPPK